jgi:multidrug efflux pump subunit AcrA (membrane-fusion protein)
MNAKVLIRMTMLCCLLLVATAGCQRGGAEDGDAEGAGSDGKEGDVADGDEASGEDGEEAGPRPTVDRRVEQVVTADGELVYPAAPQGLPFSASGRLVEVAVEPGQQVLLGDLIARIDPTSLELAVADAQAAEINARLQVEALEKGTEIERARLQWEQSKNSRWGSQAIRDATCGRVKPFFEQASCDQSDANVNAAEQSVQLAELSLRSLEATRESDLNAARLRLSSARLGLNRAREQRQLATLTAPFTGTITAVNVVPGIEVAPGSPVASLVPTSPLRFVTSNLGERYVGDIEPGDPAQITLTAYPDAPIVARVHRIDSQGSRDSSGAVVFTVYLDVDEDDDRALYAGMTGRAEITVVAKEATKVERDRSAFLPRPGSASRVEPLPLPPIHLRRTRHLHSDLFVDTHKLARAGRQEGARGLAGQRDEEVAVDVVAEADGVDWDQRGAGL